MRGILEGGERVAWGAKAIPEGGYWAMPKPSAPGMVVAGDSAGMVNVPILKGIHYAIHAGIMAAEEIFAALKRNSTDFSAYDQRVEDSLIGKELYQSRNMKQPFAKGFFVGGADHQRDGHLQGPLPRWALEQPPRRRVAGRGRRQARELSQARRQVHVRQALERLHLGQRDPRRRAQPHPRAPERAARGRRGVGVDVPGRRLRDPRRRGWGDEFGNVDVIVNYTNCVQCGAITAKGGRLTTPEGGDGPLYQVT